MKKQILNTIGLAVAAALFCVTCSDNGLTKNPNGEAGDANALTGKFYGKDNPTTDPCEANPAPGCPNYCQVYPTAAECQPEPITYTLTVSRNNAGGGSVSRNPDKQDGYDPGEKVTVTATPKDGYAFTGWTGEATGTTNPVEITMDGDKTLTANFEWQDAGTDPPETRYELIVHLSPTSGVGSVSLDPDPSDYANGATVKATATASAGYRFTGWSDAASGTTNPVTITMNENKTLIANFEPLPRYTISFNANGGNVNPSTATTGTDGKLTSLPTPTRTGHTFNGWFTAATGGTSVTLSTVFSANTTIYARWEAVSVQPTTYTLMVTRYPTNGGTTSPASPQSNITSGTAVNISATPASGYTFNNWTVTSGTATIANPNSASTTVTLSSDATVRANFTQSGGGTTYTLTVRANPPEGGNVTVNGGPDNPEPSTHNARTYVSVSATPNSTYTFMNWSWGADRSNYPTFSIMMDGDKTLTAHFELAPAYRDTIKVEAEALTSPALSACVGTNNQPMCIVSGGIGYINKGNNATYKVTVGQAEERRMVFKIASNSKDIGGPCSFNVTVNNAQVGTITGNTDGWDVFTDVTLDKSVQFNAGENTIKLNFETPVTLDYFLLIRVP